MQSLKPLVCVIAVAVLFLASGRQADARYVAQDTLRAVVADTLAAADSLAADGVQADSLMTADTARKGMLEMPAFSTAVDSVIEDFSSGRQMIYYYGEASVTYGDMKLTAEYMEYDVERQVVYAAGVADTAGVVKGKPEMTQGGKTYSMDNVFYNFKTNKARIKNVVTSEEDGVLRGENINMMPDRSVNISGGKYTVCDAEHPHFYLKMTKAKIETQPKQKTVFGPAYLVLADVPLYPLMLPFGFVPKRPERASGILFPNFGEEASRGLFIKDGGVYFVLGDYFDVALTGSLYSKGSWNVNMSTRYKLRYKFDGSLDITYSNDQTGERGSTDFFQTKNFSVKWSHAQDSKARPGTSFRASVNFSSPSNNQYNYTDINQALENQVSSSISYSRTWSALSVSVNGLHSQNSRDSSYAITLPNITLNVNRFYPFRRKNRVGPEKWYEQFALSYNTTLQNKINFKASEVRDPDFWDKMQTGMTHNFSIGLPTFTILKYLTLAPSVSYGMNWYFSSQSMYYNPETDEVETIRTGLFEDFGASHNFSASASLSTRLYGLFNFRRGKLKAIRHMISPSLSVSYAPEMGTRLNGYRVYNYTDIYGVDHSVEYNKWAGGLYSPPSPGQTASLGFQIGNNLEAKVVDRKDTTGTGMKKIKLIDNLNISGSYNFLADSMKLSNINVNMTTNVLEKVSISAGMTLDPYAVDGQGQRYNRYNVTAVPGFRLVRLTNANVSLGFSLQGEGKGKGNDGSLAGGGGGGVKVTGESPAYTRVFYHPVTGEYIPGGWVYYLNPEVPWSLSFNYSYNYSKSYQYSNDQLIVRNNHTQTLNVTGQVRITKALNLNLTSGFDITRLRLTTTQISATYDLHCFQISFSWVPIGQWKQWSFRINAKAAALADLLSYRKGTSQWDN
ncbi:MAG TPA: LPS-assembly protein LptD [Candidatus Coprenecus stercorigallinarum]|nr:LPS-assembly protein LptD [Candidatus Coprenecus stercorigallinarum]